MSIGFFAGFKIKERKLFERFFFFDIATTHAISIFSNNF